MNTYFVYILASRRNGTLYTGVTNNLFKRVWQHRNDEGVSFTKKYGVHRLVWFEEHGEIDEAIRREKRIKRWKRSWKLELIEKETRTGPTSMMNASLCDPHQTPPSLAPDPIQGSGTQNRHNDFINRQLRPWSDIWNPIKITNSGSRLCAALLPG